MTDAPVGVEGALRELRELWPGCSAKIAHVSTMGFFKEPQSWVEVLVITPDYEIHDEKAEGETLADCMAQVRAWKVDHQ